MRSPLLVRVAAGAGVALVALIGIALTNNGSPIYTANEPAPHGLQTVVPPTTTSGTAARPPRPRNLSLDNVSPCRILTAAQRSSLSLDGVPTPYVDEEFDQARACTIRGKESGTVARFALVTGMGIDVWLSDTAQVHAQPVTTEGFPALVVRTPGLDDTCNVEVDTAQNQFLDVMFRDGGNVPPIPQDELCLGAQRVADAAMVSLLAGH